MFPVSDRAFDIVDALRRYASGAQVMLADAKEIRLEGGAVCGVTTSRGFVPAEHVILATGGKSYPATGSDGSGYEIAKALGHTIVAPEPSLVPLHADPAICMPLSGLSLKNVELSLLCDGKSLYREMGEMLFTHTGISGPLVLSASVFMRGAKGQYEVLLDLKPALDEAALDLRLLREIETAPNINFSNLLPNFFLRAMTRVICDCSGISLGLKLNVMTRQQRMSLIRDAESFSDRESDEEWL